ncbi:MAG: hypothetical protein ABSC94_03520 [Polyangiaceae bacterium]|jgi:hypothetical protein
MTHPLRNRGSILYAGATLVLTVFLPTRLAAQSSASAGRPVGAEAHASNGSVAAATPGFEVLPDGSTRLLLGLSAPAPYKMKSVGDEAIYVFKAVRVGRKNDCNPLLTRYFNTPVTVAQLVPHGRDLWLVVTMRANVTPTVTVESPGGGGSQVSIQFPKGNYLPPESKDAEAAYAGPLASEPTTKGASSAVQPPPANRMQRSGRVHPRRGGSSTSPPGPTDP